MSSTYSPITSEFEIIFKLSPSHQSTLITTTIATKAIIDYNRLNYEL